MNKLEHKTIKHVINLLRDIQVAVNRAHYGINHTDKKITVTGEIADAHEHLKEVFGWLIPLSEKNEEKD